jgi:hypothetical protein
MPTKMLAALLLIVSALLLSSGHSTAAGKRSAARPDPAMETVDKVLRAELTGQVDRREQLAGALASQPDSPATRWQAGFVRVGKSWRSYDETISTPAESESHREYLTRRENSAKTFDGQLELANWCRKQGLVDQEYAHLQAALTLAPARDNTAGSAGSGSVVRVFGTGTSSTGKRKPHC